MTAAETFKSTVAAEMSSYGLSLDDKVQLDLAVFYELLSRWNSRLHLVAPCSPEEFATRHVLESLVLLNHLPPDASVVDVGSGGGLPLIPCLIALKDLRGTLIESATKKGVFLREALHRLELSTRAKVLVQRFEETDSLQADFVTCRAMEQLVEHVPELLSWRPNGSKLLLFGGELVGESLLKNGVEFERVLLPNSERRFLFVEL